MKKFFKTKKIIIIIILSFLLLACTISISTYARLKNRVIDENIVEWDGSIATSYSGGTGSKNNPYLISNASEFAYFANNLKSNNYTNTYFKITNDIIINKGLFTYSDNKISYKIDNNTYSINEYTNKLYLDSNYYDSINLFDMIENFKGTIDGNYKRIYGLYITSSDSEELSLFKNLEGNINNLYLENTLIYGGNITSSLAVNANNSSINNFLFDGYVVGKNNTLNKNIENNIEDKTLTFTEEEKTKTLNLNINSYYGKINSIKLKGTCSSDNELCSNVKINDTLISDNFEITLSTNYLENINISLDTNNEEEITLSNLKYVINYDISDASGLFITANNTNINNAVIKGNIYGNLNAYSFIGYNSGASNITNSYNLSNLYSNLNTYSLVGNSFSSTLKINKCYNDGLLSSANTYFIGFSINNSKVDITNSFNTKNITNSNDLIDSTSSINVTNSYNTSSITSNFTTGQLQLLIKETLKDKTFIKDTLTYLEYENDNNDNKVWLIEDNNLPISYMDDISSNVELYLSSYVYNNYSNDLNTYNFNSDIKFIIKNNDEILDNKIYYYIGDENILSKGELSLLDSWTLYSSDVTITNEGKNIIYVKIVDNNDSIKYINSDILVLDKTEADVTISIGNYSSNNYNSEISNTSINKNSNITINATDDLSGIKSVEYLISDTLYSIDDIKNIESFTKYQEPFTYNDITGKIIYAKVTDNCNFIKYVNTNYIYINGFSITSFKLGNEDISNNANISSLSNITYNFLYEANYDINIDNYKLKTNYKLPVNTKITLKDNNNKIFVYKVTKEDDKLYDLDKFNLLGNLNNIAFDSLDYKSLKNYNFVINIDFSLCNIDSNINDLTLELNSYYNDNLVIQTLDNDIKTINIIKASSPNLSISSSVNNLDLSNNGDYTIDILSKLEDSQILDNYYEDYIIALKIEVYDSDDNKILKSKLKDLVFSINDKNYYVLKDSSVRINLNNSINESNINLIIEVDDDINLSNGNYYFKISNYLTYDGLYSATDEESSIEIPFVINKNKDNINYTFDVIDDNFNRIISNSSENELIKFNIIQNNITNPNIRVSLYKKKYLTAYNQEYEIIDLKNYITNNLSMIKSNTYYAILNPISYDNTTSTYNSFSINLNPSLLSKNAYELVFELYDDNIKISQIEKKFIVR